MPVSIPRGKRNGRAAREFFRTLAFSAGYQLNYGLISKDELLFADIEAYGKNYEPLITLLNAAVERPQ